MAKKIDIAGQLNSAAADNKLADASQIYDSKKGKFQEKFNEDIENKVESYKQELELDVNNAVANLIGGASETFDTLKEFEDWINNDESGAAAIAKQTNDNKTAISDLQANTGISEYPTFDTAVDYAVGDVVKYEGRLYRFTAEHAAGEWNAEQVEEWSERKEVEGKVTELESEVIYDVTANNNGATFASLSALLFDENLSTLIPSAIRCGGMSIRFIQSSNNKYMQYRLMSDTFNTTVANWQGVDDVPIAGSENLVTSGGVMSKISKHAELTYDFNNRPTLQSGFLNNDGTVASSDSRKVTDFISIPQNTTKISVSKGYQTAIGYCYCCFYDVNQVFISSLSVGSASEDVNQEITNIPVNSKYVRFNYVVKTVSSTTSLDFLYKVFFNFEKIEENANKAAALDNLITNFDSEKGEEILDYDHQPSLEAGFLNSDGTVATSESRKVTGFLEIPYGINKITISKSYQTAIGYCYGCFYDVDKNFMSVLSVGKTSENVNQVITEIPSTAKYLRFNFNLSNRELTTSIDFSYDIVLSLQNYVLPYNLQLFHGGVHDEGYIYNIPIRVRTDYLGITPFHISLNEGYKIVKVAYFTKDNHRFVGWYNNNPYLYLSSFDYIPNKFDCIIVFSKDNGENLTPDDDIIKELYVPYSLHTRLSELQEQINEIASIGKLKGTKIYCLGSSSTQALPIYGNKAWPEWIGEWNRSNVVNLGASGYTLIQDPDAAGSIYNYYERVPSDAEYVLIMIGANDVYSNAVTFEDNGQTTDFISAYKNFIEQLTIRAPKATVGLIIPFQTGGMVSGQGGTNYAAMKQAIKDIGQMYAIQVLDVGEYGFNGLFANNDVTEYSSAAITARQNALSNLDGGHLNGDGQKKMAKVIDGFINNI